MVECVGYSDPPPTAPDTAMKISARNTFAGTVKRISEGAVNNEIVVEMADGSEIVSIITRSSSERLGLKVGIPVYTVIKASDVMIATE